MFSSPLPKASSVWIAPPDSRNRGRERCGNKPAIAERDPGWPDLERGRRPDEMPECLRARSAAMVRALANDSMGHDVGLFLRRGCAGRESGRRRDVLHGPGNAGLRRLFGRLPGGQACLVQAGSALQRGYAGLLGQSKMRLRISGLSSLPGVASSLWRFSGCNSGYSVLAGR